MRGAPTAKWNLANGPAKTACRVLLYENNELVRAGIRTILNAQPDITVVAEAGRGSNVTGLIWRWRPNVIVSEFSPDVPNIDARPGHPISTFGQLPLVAMCEGLGSAEMEKAIRIGARGLVLRNDPPRQVVDAVREVAAGNGFLAPSVAGYVLDQLNTRLPAVDSVTTRKLDQLTAREREVLRLVASGLTTAQVAETLQRSRATVKSHISHALTKLGLQDRAQAIALAYRAGLVTNTDAHATVVDFAIRHPLVPRPRRAM